MGEGGLIVLNLDAESTLFGKLRATDVQICSWVAGEKHSKAVVLADLSLLSSLLFWLFVLIFYHFRYFLFISSLHKSTLCVSLSYHL